MSLFQGKDYSCRDWMFKKGCDNKQSEKADNGLCERCEKERRILITKQLKDLVNTISKKQ